MGDGVTGTGHGKYQFQPTEEHTFFEKWADRPKLVPVVHSRKGGPAYRIPPGSEIERQFKQLWASGTTYKVISHVLAEDFEIDLSTRSLKEARIRLKLPTRRPMIGSDLVELKFAVPRRVYVALRKSAQSKGVHLSRYVRLQLTKMTEG